MFVPNNRMPSHPGEILLHEFIEPLELTQKQIAEHLGWTYARVNEIVNGKRGVTADSALSLSEAFGVTPDFWLNLQTIFDLYQAKQKHKHVEPLKVA